MISTSFSKREPVIRALCEEKLSLLYQIIRSHNGFEDFPAVKLIFTANVKAAGSAYRKNYVYCLKLNSAYFVDDKDEQVNITLPHELAHLVFTYAYWNNLIPKKKYPAHNNIWKYYMLHWFNLNPEVRHNMDTNANQYIRKQVRWLYICKCPNKLFRISTTKHNRIRKGYYYTCPYCKQRLIKKE